MGYIKKRRVILLTALLAIALTGWHHNGSASEFLRPVIFKQLEKVRKALEANDNESVEQILANLNSKYHLSAYEQAHTCNLSAFYHFQQSHLEKALADFQCVLDQDNLPQDMRLNALISIAQLHYETGNYQETLKRIEAIESLSAEQNRKPEKTLTLLKAYSLYQLEKYQAAIAVIKPMAFPVTDTNTTETHAGKPPEQTLLLLLQACYHQLQDYQAMAVTLEILVKHYPSAQHMTALASVYSQIDAPDKHLALLESLWESQLLDGEAHIRNLIALQLQAGTPFKAANNLQKALQAGNVDNTAKHQLQLAQAWIAAREEGRAIQALEAALTGFEHNSAALPDSETNVYADLCFLLGQLYFQQRQWSKSITRLQQCIRQPSEKLSHSYLLLGISLINQQRFEQAKQYLQLAQQNKRFGRQAKQWLNYSRAEKARLTQLKQSL